MLQKELIQQFLKNSDVAVIGVSRKGDIPANYIYRKLRAAGYRVYAVNPNADEIEGDRCYHSLAEIDTPLEAVFMAGSPRSSELAAAACASKGIKHVWMHRGIGNGSYSVKAEAILKEAGIQTINNGCPLMYLKPVDPFHRVLRWLKS